MLAGVIKGALEMVQLQVLRDEMGLNSSVQCSIVWCRCAEVVLDNDDDEDRDEEDEIEEDEGDGAVEKTNTKPATACAPLH